MVALLLIVVWLVALTPFLLRKLSERNLGSSIDRFHGGARAMSRATPAPTAIVAEELDPEELALRARRERERERRLVARRRKVLGRLVGAFAGPFVLGLIPPLRPLLYLSIVTGLALVGYVALLIRLKQLAAEAAAVPVLAANVVPLRRRESGAGEPQVSQLPPARPAFVVLDARG